MSKSFKISLFILLIIIPLASYLPFYLSSHNNKTIPSNEKNNEPIKIQVTSDNENSDDAKDNEPDNFAEQNTPVLAHTHPKIALIFDDLGERLKEIKEIYALNIPVTISIIPGLKFSKNIAYIGAHSGFSILIHLPLEPHDKGGKFNTPKYKFISSSQSKREINTLLRYYLDYIRIAIGVNNHMGSAATEDRKLMKTVIQAIKRKGLIFIDSKTSEKSVAYDVARDEGVICGYNEGFLDSIDDEKIMQEKINEFIKIAKEKEKIIVIAHPKYHTLNFLKRTIPQLKNKVQFITIKEYFEK